MISRIIFNVIDKKVNCKEERRRFMHEFSTMQMIMETALKVAVEHKAGQILGINLEIGELTFLNTEQLRFAFSILSEGTIANKAKLYIKRIKPKIKCLDCKFEGEVKKNRKGDSILYTPVLLKCPICKSTNVEIISGRECNIKNIKIKLLKKSK
jgi:hydrogenase nickel incorporation protein HypA/HybF